MTDGTDKTADAAVEGRRSFLKLAALSAPAAAAGSIVAGEASAAEEAPKSAGLRRTPHTDAYFASVRF